MHFLSFTYVGYQPGGPPGAHPHWERSGATWTKKRGPKSWASARSPSKRKRSLRLDVAPKTNRPGPRGAVVTDITKRPRICDPLTSVRTSRRAPPSRGSQMCPACLGSVTSSYFFISRHRKPCDHGVCFPQAPLATATSTRTLFRKRLGLYQWEPRSQTSQTSADISAQRPERIHLGARAPAVP